MERPKFFHTRMGELFLIAKIRANPSLRRIFQQQKYITKEIRDDLHHRTQGQTEGNYTLFITGATGTLKSSVAQTIVKEHDPTFRPQKRVSFQYEEHENQFTESNAGEAYILDEQVFQYGTGSTRLITNIQEKMETLRRRKNPLIVISPERKYFPEELFTYTLETIDNSITATCPSNPAPHEPRNCTCWLNKTAKITNCRVRLGVKQEGVYMGFYECDIDWNNPDWHEYEKKKDAFMQAIVEGKKKNTDYEQIAQKLLEHPDIKSYKKNNELKIFIQKHKPNLTTEENKLVVSAIRMIRKRTEENQAREDLHAEKKEGEEEKEIGDELND